MANAAAKRIHAENAKMLRFLDIGTLTTMVLADDVSFCVVVP